MDAILQKSLCKQRQDTLRLKRKRLKLLLLVSGLFFLNHAFAENQTYAEISYLDLRIAEPRVTAKPAAVKGVFGQKYGDILSYEALYARGTSHDNFRFGIINGSVMVNSIFGLYAKGAYQIGEHTDSYARFGLALTNISLDARLGPYQTSQSVSGADISYGLGARHKLNNELTLVLDYTSYYAKANVKINGLSVGASFNF